MVYAAGNKFFKRQNFFNGILYQLFDYDLPRKNTTFSILQPFVKKQTQWQQYLCEFSEFFDANILYRIPVKTLIYEI